ncbi:hypothetical protein [Thermococcus sp. 2319x1]|uniref:hypothetical protein n=1 Tax=Thermococcus sp. 2319x1 TaxID=1674923 RepID=UPI0011873334|nr:hypothetical protein [Thermococcus sp. 2319x1]
MWIEKGGRPSVIRKLNVVKFGGGSVRDSFWSALKLGDYLYENSNVVVVVSALKDVTEDLLLLSTTKDREIPERVRAEVESLLSELEKALHAVPSGENRQLEAGNSCDRSRGRNGPSWCTGLGMDFGDSGCGKERRKEPSGSRLKGSPML